MGQTGAMTKAERTLETLLANHARFLRFLEPRVGGREAAEDVLQAAFVKGLTKAQESAVAWFYRLLRNAVIDHHRRGAAEKRRLEVHSRGLSEVDGDALRETVCECVGELIPLLKPEYAVALRRAELEGASLQTLADELGITPNNAGVRLHRARAALKKKLEETCGTCTEHGCLRCSCGEN
jgi:RNA polymerase sigma factor (sigma-70 family)